MAQESYDFNISNSPWLIYEQRSHLPDAEASQLAEDLHKLGTLAAATEVGAGLATGNEVNPSEVLPNPIKPKQLEPRRVYVDDDVNSRKTEKKSDEVLTKLDSEIKDDQQVLDSLFGADDQTRRHALSELVNRARSRGDTLYERTDVAINNLDLPPYIRAVKGKTHLEDGWTGKTVTDWPNYLRIADERQIANFAQWYTGELRKVATPEGKAAEVAQKKAQYLEGVDSLIEDGWISEVVKAKIEKRVEKTNVFFASVFSREATRVQGQHASTGRNILLVLGSPREIADHEFTHAAGRIELMSLVSKAIEGHDEIDPEDEEAMGRFIASTILVKTIFDEGFAMHITNAINFGEPGIMSKGLRSKSGVESDQITPQYDAYLETLSMLLEGVEGNGHIDERTMSTFITSMVMGNTNDIAELIANRWDGEDVLKQVMELIHSQSADDEGIRNPTKFGQPSAFIADESKVMEAIKTFLGDKQRGWMNSTYYPEQAKEDKAA